jgi:hypothetical protein
VLQYAAKPYPAANTEQGRKDLHELDKKLDVLIGSNVRDAVGAHWSWAALELRIVERENGPLSEHHELVGTTLAENWPTLRAQWKTEELQLWIKEDELPRKETSPLNALPHPKK